MLEHNGRQGSKGVDISYSPPPLVPPAWQLTSRQPWGLWLVMAYCLGPINAWPPLCPQRSHVNKSAENRCGMVGQQGSTVYLEHWVRADYWMPPPHSKKSTNWGLKLKEGNRKWPDNYPDKFKIRLWHVKGRKDQKIRASPELKARQMLGNPQGINWHIKHNITSSTGAQSLVLSGELLYYVLLPQFKSQELEANTAQAFWAHSALRRGAMCTQHRLFLYVLSNIRREINVKSSGSQPPTRAPDCLWTPNLRCDETQLFNKQ